MALKRCDEILRKTTYEEKYFKFDFADDLELTDTIATAAFTATPSGTGHIACGSPTISGTQVQTKITLGVADTRYTVTCKITTTLGEKIEGSAFLDVKSA